MLSSIARKANDVKRFLYPPYPQDDRPPSRLKRGLMNYATLKSRWGVPFVQEIVKKQRFSFRYRQGSSTYNLKVSGSDASHLWAADEVFVGNDYDLSKVGFEPDVILDLGANIGMFTLLAAKRWPQATFVCVEPHPKTFSFLCENLQMNHVVASKLQCAVSDQVSFQYLQDESEFALSQHLTASGNSRTRTLTLLLDSLLPSTMGGDSSKSGLLIKVDIEGAERAVLSALKAKLPERCFIFLELHEGDDALRWVTKWAEEHNFKYVQGRRIGAAITGYLSR